MAFELKVLSIEKQLSIAKGSSDDLHLVLSTKERNDDNQSHLDTSHLFFMSYSTETFPVSRSAFFLFLSWSYSMGSPVDDQDN